MWIQVKPANSKNPMGMDGLYFLIPDGCGYGYGCGNSSTHPISVLTCSLDVEPVCFEPLWVIVELVVLDCYSRGTLEV